MYDEDIVYIYVNLIKKKVSNTNRSHSNVISKYLPKK